MLNLEEICALRDKLIMDDTYSVNEQTFMYHLLQNEIYGRRLGFEPPEKKGFIRRLLKR